MVVNFWMSFQRGGMDRRKEDNCIVARGEVSVEFLLVAPLSLSVQLSAVYHFLLTRGKTYQTLCVKNSKCCKFHSFHQVDMDWSTTVFCVFYKKISQIITLLDIFAPLQWPHSACSWTNHVKENWQCYLKHKALATKPTSLKLLIDSSLLDLSDRWKGNKIWTAQTIYLLASAMATSVNTFMKFHVLSKVMMTL